MFFLIHAFASVNMVGSNKVKTRGREVKVVIHHQLRPPLRITVLITGVRGKKCVRERL